MEDKHIPDVNFRSDFSSVMKWTKGIDLFTKDFIFVPINEKWVVPHNRRLMLTCKSAHWYLAVICNLSRMERKMSNTSSQNDDAVSTTTISNEDIGSHSKMSNGSSKSSRKSSPVEATEATPEEAANGLLEEIPDEAGQESVSDGSTSNPICVDSQAKDFPKKDTQSARESSAPNPPPRHGKETIDITQSPVTPKKNRDMSPDQPLILILDSLNLKSQNNVFKTLREYLAAEAKDKRALELPTDSKDGISGVYGPVPSQENYCDCGVYVIHYIEQFIAQQDRAVEYFIRNRNQKYKTKKDQAHDESWYVKPGRRKELLNLVKQVKELQDVDEGVKKPPKPTTLVPGTKAIIRAAPSTPKTRISGAARPDAPDCAEVTEAAAIATDIEMKDDLADDTKDLDASNPPPGFLPAPSGMGPPRSVYSTGIHALTENPACPQTFLESVQEAVDLARGERKRDSGQVTIPDSQELQSTYDSPTHYEDTVMSGTEAAGTEINESPPEEVDSVDTEMADADHYQPTSSAPGSPLTPSPDDPDDIMEFDPPSEHHIVSSLGYSQGSDDNDNDAILESASDYDGPQSRVREHTVPETPEPANSASPSPNIEPRDRQRRRHTHTPPSPDKYRPRPQQSFRAQSAEWVDPPPEDSELPAPGSCTPVVLRSKQSSPLPTAPSNTSKKPQKAQDIEGVEPFANFMEDFVVQKEREAKGKHEASSSRPNRPNDSDGHVPESTAISTPHRGQAEKPNRSPEAEQETGKTRLEKKSHAVTFERRRRERQPTHTPPPIEKRDVPVITSETPREEGQSLQPTNPLEKQKTPVPAETPADNDGDSDVEFLYEKDVVKPVRSNKSVKRNTKKGDLSVPSAGQTAPTTARPTRRKSHGT